MIRYTFDPDAAKITFDATTSLHPVVASAPVEGWLKAEIADDGFVPGSSLSGSLEVAVADISSGNPIYDTETRRRIDVKAHPLIVAELTKATVSDTSAVVEGTVDFHGTSTLLEGEVRLEPGPVLTGTGTIDIRWWDLRPPSLMVFKVQPEVLITVSLPLVEAG